jgi:hypothetical protein
MKDIVVLDACVLYGAYTRDLLLTFAYEGLYIGNWSEKILEEYAGNLNKNRPDLLKKDPKTPEAVIEKLANDQLSLTADLLRSIFQT